jgi:hypothetical protein
MLQLCYLTEEWGGGGSKFPKQAKKTRFNRAKFTHIEVAKNSEQTSEGPFSFKKETLFVYCYHYCRKYKHHRQLENLERKICS